MDKVYLAAPVVGITDVQKIEIEKVINVLREEGLEVYDPKKISIPNAWNMSMSEWGRCVFTCDVLAIDDCEYMVVCDYGRNATVGTAWEAGYAFAKNKRIVVIQMPQVEEVSLMLRNCGVKIMLYEEIKDGINFIHKNKDEVIQN